MSKKDYSNTAVDLLLTTVTFSDIIFAVNHEDYATKVFFVKELDQVTGDWEFTRKLYKHFKKLAKEHDKETRKTYQPGDFGFIDLWSPTKKERKLIKKYKKKLKKGSEE